MLFAVFCCICANFEICNLFHADVHRAVTNCKIKSLVKDFAFSGSHTVTLTLVSLIK